MLSGQVTPGSSGRSEAENQPVPGPVDLNNQQSNACHQDSIIHIAEAKVSGFPLICFISMRPPMWVAGFDAIFGVMALCVIICRCVIVFCCPAVEMGPSRPGSEQMVLARLD
eukprot:scaffold167311_cov42-Prasinocladus_malaysianus.AAC.1